MAAAHAHATSKFSVPLNSHPSYPPSSFERGVLALDPLPLLRRLLALGRLIVEEGGFLYDSDAYNDDLPYWNTEHGKPHLIIPYSLDANDMRFATPQGFNSGDQFFTYLRDSLDFLLEVLDEGALFLLLYHRRQEGGGEDGRGLPPGRTSDAPIVAAISVVAFH